MQHARAASYFWLCHNAPEESFVSPCPLLICSWFYTSTHLPGRVRPPINWTCRSLASALTLLLRNTAGPTHSANSGSIIQTPPASFSHRRSECRPRMQNATRCNCNVSLQHEAQRGLIVLISVLSSQQFVKNLPAEKTQVLAC